MRLSGGRYRVNTPCKPARQLTRAVPKSGQWNPSVECGSEKNRSRRAIGYLVRASSRFAAWSIDNQRKRAYPVAITLRHTVLRLRPAHPAGSVAFRLAPPARIEIPARLYASRIAVLFRFFVPTGSRSSSSNNTTPYRSISASCSASVISSMGDSPVRMASTSESS